MFGTIALVLGLGFWLASKYHTDDGATCAAVGAIVLFVVSLLRPSWFWNHAKVVLVRSILGDTGASVFYVAISLGLGLFGANRVAYWRAAGAQCSHLYSSAIDSHRRTQVIQGRPDSTIGGIIGFVGKPQFLTCEKYRERGAWG